MGASAVDATRQARQHGAMRPGCCRFILLSLCAAGLAGGQTEAVPRAVPTTGRPIVRTWDSETHGFGGLCQDVLVDRAGRVWIAGDDPLVFDGVRWQRAPRPWIGPVLALAADGEGQIWVGAINHIGRIRSDPLRVEKLTDQLPDAHVGRLTEAVTHAGGVVFASTSHVVRCAGDQVQSWEVPSGVKELALAAGVPLVRAQDGRDYQLQPDGRWEPATATPARWRLSGPVVVSARAEAWLAQHPALSALRLPDGRVAVGLRYNGLLVLGADGEIQEHFTVNEGLADNDCPRLALDAQGGLWVTHRNAATVSRISLGAGVRSFSRAEGLQDIVYLAQRIGGALIVAGANSHWRQRADGLFARVPDTRGGGWSAFQFQGEIWWPGRSAGRLAGEVWEPVAPLAGRTVRAWCADPQVPGGVYAGTNQGIFRLRREGGVWSEPELVFQDGQNSSWLADFGDGWLWQGVNYGNLRRIDLRKPLAERTAEWIEERHGRPKQEPGDLMFPVLFEGRFALACGGGFFVWNAAAGRFEPWAEGNALLSPGERGVQSAGISPGVLWWQERSDAGWLRRLAPEDGRRQARELSGGIFRGAYVESVLDDPATGRVWAASRNSLIALPTSGPPAAASVRAGVREVLGQAQRSLWQDGAGTAECTPPLGERDLRLYFAATDFEADLKGRSGLTFRTRLSGYDDWSRWSAEAQRDYTNLAPGRYRFELEARTLGGALVSGQPLDLVILPRWWETAWARAALGTAATLLLGLGAGRWAQRRLRERVRRLNVEAALQQERLRIARDMHDGVGSGLGRLRLTLEQARKPEAGSRREELLAQASDNAQELAEQAREIIWAVTPENDTLDNLLDRLAETVQSAAQAAGLRCRLDLPAESQPLPVHATTRHQVLLAVKEAVHNAIKHARASELRLSASCSDGRLEVELADDGCGFDPTAGGRPGGLGLDSLRARAAALQGEARIESATGGGTRVCLCIPLATPG